MRGFLKRALLAAAIVVGVLVPAFAQSTVPPEQSESASHNDARASNHAARLVCHRVDRLRSSFADDWYGDTGPRVDAQRSLSLDARLRAGSGGLASGRRAGPAHDHGPFHATAHTPAYATPQTKTRGARPSLQYSADAHALVNNELLLLSSQAATRCSQSVSLRRGILKRRPRASPRYVYRVAWAAHLGPCSWAGPARRPEAQARRTQNAAERRAIVSFKRQSSAKLLRNRSTL